MALGRRAHDREAEPRAAAGAPEAVEGALGVGRSESLALVAHAEQCAAVPLRRRHGDAAASVPTRVLDEIGERALQRRRVAAHDDRRGRVDVDVVCRDGAGELVETNLLVRAQRDVVPASIELESRPPLRNTPSGTSAINLSLTLSSSKYANSSRHCAGLTSRVSYDMSQYCLILVPVSSTVIQWPGCSLKMFLNIVRGPGT